MTIKIVAPNVKIMLKSDFCIVMLFIWFNIAVYLIYIHYEKVRYLRQMS